MSLIQAIERRLPSGYRIQDQIGSGATSWVYLARSEGDAPALVVKVMHPGMQRDASVDRFVREMQILRTLDHPRIIPILEPGEADGALFFTMPYVPGETLCARLAEGGPLPIREALVVARDLCEALGHAHGRGIVHRDVKPANPKSIRYARPSASRMFAGFTSRCTIPRPCACPSASHRSRAITTASRTGIGPCVSRCTRSVSPGT